ncbi:MAG: GNAT family protein [Dehalococcoidia bacterium]|nr:GNAT family protein [Dehalococcoidia bacterium]
MITTSRMRLREKRLSDGRDDYAWRTDPELARLDAASVLNISYSQYLAEYAFELSYPSSNRREFAIERMDGKHIGNCVYYNIDVVKGEAEIGIILGDRSCWGNGYGTEAVNTLLDYVFRKTALERIYLHTLDWNVRAQKCFQKCGFTEYGRLVKDGYDFINMEIRRSDWEQRHQEPESQQVDPD